jgi:4a-hydroxytetrahydrobiopterin dehydratase
MASMSDEELSSSLNGLPGWQIIDGTLRKIYTMPSFMAALDLVNRVGELAEAAGHHPDIIINYNRVTFSLVTHDEGGITQKDVDLATQIEGVAA